MRSFAVHKDYSYYYLGGKQNEDFFGKDYPNQYRYVVMKNGECINQQLDFTYDEKFSLIPLSDDNFSFYKDTILFQFPIYYLPLGQECILPETKEELSRPYLFIMGHDLHAKHIFFPSMKHPEMSKKYYQEVFYLLNDTNGAEDIFSQKMIDLGTITKGKTYEARFKYSNRTTDRLVLTDVKSSCGCTVPQWDKRPLDKDKSSDLVVLFTPETLGYSSKFVMVSHNKSDYPVRLIIKANVE